VIGRAGAQVGLAGLGLLAVLAACSPSGVFAPASISTTTTSAPAPAPVTTTEEPRPTLEEVCGADRASLEALIGTTEPYLGAAQAEWETYGGEVLGCFDDVLPVGQQRVIRLVTAAGVDNAVFAADADTTAAVAVFAPFTGSVESAVLTGTVTQVKPRLEVDGHGLVTLVGFRDGSCRLIVALVHPIEGRLVVTFDDWQSLNIIQRAVESSSHTMVVQEITPRVHQVRLTGTLRGTDDDVVLDVSDESISVGGVRGRRTTDAPEPCPYGWYDRMVAVMGD
jgi:hypothetical protein